MNFPLTRTVKILIIINVVIFFVFQIIGQLFLKIPFSAFFALYPGKLVGQFFIWQPFTYMFLHSVTSITHIVFNMLMLWFMGAELELRWGQRRFLAFYLLSGFGAGLIYSLGTVLYAVATGATLSLMIPVVGASGAIYGLMLAYGLLFGDRIMYFFMLFPMKARYFVLILGLIQLASLMTSGVGGGEVAYLAHLGGIIAGYLTLRGQDWWLRYQNDRKKGRRGGLKLVVDNEKSKKNSTEGPRYWN